MKFPTETLPLLLLTTGCRNYSKSEICHKRPPPNTTTTIRPSNRSDQVVSEGARSHVAAKTGIRHVGIKLQNIYRGQ